jgi:hypothetical protein
MAPVWFQDEALLVILPDTEKLALPLTEADRLPLTVLVIKFIFDHTKLML